MYITRNSINGFSIKYNTTRIMFLVQSSLHTLQEHTTKNHYFYQNQTLPKILTFKQYHPHLEYRALHKPIHL